MPPRFGCGGSERLRGLRARKVGRSRTILADLLAVLDRSRRPHDVDLPGFRLHPLKVELKGHYAVTVSGNWRLTFRFEDGHVADVDTIDYH